MRSKNRSEMRKKLPKNTPKKLLLIIKKKWIWDFMNEKNYLISFLVEHFSTLGNIFSPQTHDCLNNIEIVVFITFKIIPWTHLSLSYFLLVSSLMLENYKSLNFLFLLSFLLSFLSFFKISKASTKLQTFYFSFFISFFLSFFLLVLKSPFCYDWWLVCFLFFLFRCGQLQIPWFCLSFFFTFSSQLTVTTADLSFFSYIFSMWQVTNHIIRSFFL